MSTLPEIADALYSRRQARRRAWPEGWMVGFSLARMQFYSYIDGKPDLTHFLSEADRDADDWELIDLDSYIEKWKVMRQA